MNVKSSLTCHLMLLFLSLYLTANITLAATEQQVAEFDDAALVIEKLIDSDVASAAQKLMVYTTKIEALPLKQKITYHILLADIYILQAKYHAAKDAAQRGIVFTQQLASPSILITELLYSRGFAYESIGNLDLATQDYENGLELAKSFHDKVLIATGLVNLGAIYYLTDRYENSLTVLHDAYNIAKQTSDKELQGSVNSELGILYAYLKRDEQSMLYYQQAYQDYKSANNPLFSLNALVNIATSHLNNKDYEAAIGVYETIIHESEEGGQNEIMYSVYSGLSWANLKKKVPNPEASYQYLLISKQYINDIEQHNIMLQYFSDQAFVLFELERFDEALTSVIEVEKILLPQRPLGQSKLQMHISIINLKSKIFFALGHFNKAYQLQSKRIALTKTLRDKEHTYSVAEVRLALEVKQADLEQKVLQNEQTLQEIALLEAKQKQQLQKAYLFYIAVVVLLFAWLLIKLVQGQRKLYQASSTDMLTGIANRRNLMARGRQLYKQALAKQSDLCVLMIDVDHFKTVNDTFGHSVGDQVLQKIALLGKNLMRKTDVFGRYGGEEFIIFLPNTTREQALLIAERLRLSISDYQWNNELAINVHISVGVSSLANLDENDKKDISALINQADGFLYLAKAQGRNKVCG